MHLPQHEIALEARDEALLWYSRRLAIDQIYSGLFFAGMAGILSVIAFLVGRGPGLGALIIMCMSVFPIAQGIYRLRNQQAQIAFTPEGVFFRQDDKLYPWQWIESFSFKEYEHSNELILHFKDRVLERRRSLSGIDVDEQRIIELIQQYKGAWEIYMR